MSEDSVEDEQTCIGPCMLNEKRTECIGCGRTIEEMKADSNQQ